MSLNMGKCPKCESAVTRLVVERVDVAEERKIEWHCITLLCPECSAVLGAAIDPMDLKNFVVQEVVHKLRLVQ